MLRAEALGVMRAARLVALGEEAPVTDRLAALADASDPEQAALQIAFEYAPTARDLDPPLHRSFLLGFVACLRSFAP